MIVLQVEEYCQECPDFTPDVIRPTQLVSTDGEIVHQSETVVQCKHRRRCAGITRYLNQQMKGEPKG